jgi:hypothetical protein
MKKSRPLQPPNPEFQFFRERKTAKGAPLSTLRKLNLRPIGRIAGFSVFHVNSEAVRLLDVDFTMGSHFAHSRFIPHGQIWVSQLLRPTDLAPLLVHEAVETWWMVHRKWSYEHAHDRASMFERELRKRIHLKHIRIPTISAAMIFAQAMTNEILSEPHEQKLTLVQANLTRQKRKEIHHAARTHRH